MTTSTFGRSVPRLEDADLLTGRARFVDDIRLPGMLHAAFVRSPHAHAAVLDIRTDGARAQKGVHAVYTSADLRPHLRAERLVVALPSAAFRQQVDRPVLAADEVTYVGEPVAVVIADDRYLAEDAAVLVEIDYQPLPAVVDCRTALVADAPRAHRGAPHNLVAEFDVRFGGVDAAFDGAAHVFAETLWQERGGSHSIECRGSVAAYDPLDDRLTVWSSTQTPHAAMRMIADLLGRDESRVRVVAPDVGGGFGPKLVFYSEELVTALAALLLRRPVKWIEDRREHFVATTQERGQLWQLEIATEADGRIRGVRGSMIHDHGAYTARGINVAFEAAQTMTMAYQVPACDLNVRLALTNKVPVTPVRGAGQPQGVCAMERLLDRVARELGLDRAELRRRNLVRADQMPYAKPFKTRSGVPVVIDSGDFPGCQDAALQAAGWHAFEARRRAARAEGRFLGLGMANFVELTGRGPYEPATVRIDGSGKVLVSSSATAMGQGTKTMLAQIVAAQLGGDVTNVAVSTGDSATSTTGFGGFGSRQAVTAGSSAHAAALKVRAKALAVASHLLEAAEHDLEIEGGEIRVKGAPGLKVSLGGGGARVDRDRRRLPAGRSAARHGGDRARRARRDGLRQRHRGGHCGGRRRDRWDCHSGFRSGARLRAGDQSDDRRRSDDGWDSARRRQCAARAHGVRRRRPADDDHLGGISAAGGGRGAAHAARSSGVAEPAQSARHQGGRRGRGAADARVHHCRGRGRADRIRCPHHPRAGLPGRYRRADCGRAVASRHDRLTPARHSPAQVRSGEVTQLAIAGADVRCRV